MTFATNDSIFNITIHSSDTGHLQKIKDHVINMDAPNCDADIKAAAPILVDRYKTALNAVFTKLKGGYYEGRPRQPTTIRLYVPRLTFKHGLKEEKKHILSNTGTDLIVAPLLEALTQQRVVAGQPVVADAQNGPTLAEAFKTLNVKIELCDVSNYNDSMTGVIRDGE